MLTLSSFILGIVTSWVCFKISGGKHPFVLVHEGWGRVLVGVLERKDARVIYMYIHM